MCTAFYSSNLAGTTATDEAMSGASIPIYHWRQMRQGQFGGIY